MIRSMYIVWLVLGVGLVAAEMLTLDLVLVMIGVAALLAGGAALLGAGLTVQLLVLAAGSGVGLFLVRPTVKRHLTQGPELAQGSDTLLGRRATVTAKVGPDGGQVRLDGELWRARPFDDASELTVGTPVSVLSVSGVTLYVYPQELLP